MRRDALAGAAFAGNEDVDIDILELPQHRAHLLECGTRADELFCLVLRFELVVEVGHVFVQTAKFERLPDVNFELFEVQGLCQIRKRPARHRAD